jgi:vitamin B12 transporter
VTAELRSTYSHGRTEFDGFPAPAFDLADTREYAVTDELVAYAGINASTFDGKLQNRVGFAYTDTDRENTDPDSSVPTTFDATGRNERWEYQGTLTLTDQLGGVFGVESERSELNTRSPSVFGSRIRRRWCTTRDSTASTRNCRSRRSMRWTLTGGCVTTITTRSAAKPRAAIARVGSNATMTLVRASYGQGVQGANAVSTVQRLW